MKNKLETMDAETLMTTPMQPLKFIVQGLIPQGLHVLVFILQKEKRTEHTASLICTGRDIEGRELFL